MSHRTIMYGTSDDTVTVASDDTFNEEFSAYDTVLHVGFADGTLARINYDDDGVWSIRAVRIGPGTDLRVEPAHNINPDAPATRDGDDCPLYSNKLVLFTESPILWALSCDNAENMVVAR